MTARGSTARGGTRKRDAMSGGSMYTLGRVKIFGGPMPEEMLVNCEAGELERLWRCRAAEATERRNCLAA